MEELYCFLFMFFLICCFVDYRNMVTSLIYHERIMTTTARAKELRRVAEHMITYAKAGKYCRLWGIATLIFVCMCLQNIR